MDSIRIDLLSIVNNVNSVSAQAPSFDMSTYVEDGRNAARIVEIITFIAFSLTLFTILALPFASRRWVRWLFFISAMFFCFVSATACGAALAGLTLTADVCVDPWRQVERYVNDDHEREYITYYLECAGPDLPRGWAESFEQMQSSVVDARSNAEEVKTYLDMIGLDQDLVAALVKNISIINATL